MTSLPSSDSLKSFWSKPEGKAGALFLIGLGALALWGWGTIVPFLLSMMVDTFHFALMVIATAALFWVVFSKRTHMIFRLLMRYLTGLVIQIDPIGILEDQLVQMKKRRDMMNEQIGQVRGSKQMLEDIISKNQLAATQNLALAEQARKRASTATAEEKLRMELAEKSNARKAGRKQQSNVGYQELLKKLTTLYQFLTRMSINIDYFIDDTTDEVSEQKVKYKAINSAYSAFRTALSVVTGNADEQDLRSSTLDYLAEQASMKLGMMDDIQRVTQGFMDNIDLENGAADDSAMKALDAYEQKLLTDGSTETAFMRSDAIPLKKDKEAPVPSGSGYFGN